MRRSPPWAWLGLFSAVFAITPVSPGFGQDSSRPLRIIAPLAAGSTFDLLSRALGARFEERTKQTVIVENRPG